MLVKHRVLHEQLSLTHNSRAYTKLAPRHVPEPCRANRGDAAERIRKYREILTSEYGISLPSSGSYDPTPTAEPERGYQRSWDEPSVPPEPSHLAASSRADSSGSPSARVRFSLKYRIEYGQSIRIVGSHPMFGAWTLEGAPLMQWSPGDTWVCDLDLPTNSVYEYKYVVVDSAGNARSWQAGNNAVLAVSGQDAEVDVLDNWWGDPGAKLMAGGQTMTRETRLLTWAQDINELISQQRQELRKARMEVWQAQEESKGLRQEVGGLRTQLALATQARLEMERKLTDTEMENRKLRKQLQDGENAFKQALTEARSLVEEAMAMQPTQYASYDSESDEDETAQPSQSDSRRVTVNSFSPSPPPAARPFASPPAPVLPPKQVAREPPYQPAPPQPPPGRFAELLNMRNNTANGSSNNGGSSSGGGGSNGNGSSYGSGSPAAAEPPTPAPENPGTYQTASRGARYRRG